MKKKVMKQLIGSLLIGSLVPILFWLGGFDFNSRGAGAVFTTVLFLYVAVAAYTFLGWDD